MRSDRGGRELEAKETDVAFSYCHFFKKRKGTNTKEQNGMTGRDLRFRLEVVL